MYGITRTPIATENLNCGNSIFNGDKIVCKEFMRLKQKFGIDTVVETGTYFGMTTRWFSDNFPEVHTVDCNKDYYFNALDKFRDCKQVTCHLGPSEAVLDILLPTLTGKKIMFYLDAHWHDSCPLAEEIKTIGKYFPDNAIIAIDDFKVPYKPYAFDSYNGAPIDYNLIKDALP